MVVYISTKLKSFVRFVYFSLADLLSFIQAGAELSAKTHKEETAEVIDRTPTIVRITLDDGNLRSRPCPTSDTRIRWLFGQALASVVESLDTDEFRNNLMATLKHLSEGGDGALGFQIQCLMS